MRALRSSCFRCLLAAGLLLAPACGGDDDDAFGGADESDVDEGDVDDLIDDVLEDFSETTTTEPEETIEPDTVSIDEAVHYEGFVFSIEDAVLDASEDFDGNPDPTIGRLTINVLIENLGPSEASPDLPGVHLEEDGLADEQAVLIEGVPIVPGGSKTRGEIVFDGLPADYTLDNIELVFGGDDVHQARVPLGDTGELVALSPLKIGATTAVGTAGEVSINFIGGEVIYGDPFHHNQLEADTAILVARFDLTSTPNSRTGNLSGGNIRLILPDGTSVAPRSGGNSTPIEIIDRAATLPGLVARFDIPADLRGSFQLALRGQYLATCCEEVEAAVPFELTDG